MKPIQEASLKDLLTQFMDLRIRTWATDMSPQLEEDADGELETIAGELNRRFYVTQQQNQVLVETLDRLIDYFVACYPDGGDEDELADDLEQLKDKLQGEQP